MWGINCLHCLSVVVTGHHIYFYASLTAVVTFLWTELFALLTSWLRQLDSCVDDCARTFCSVDVIITSVGSGPDLLCDPLSNLLNQKKNREIMLPNPEFFQIFQLKPSNLSHLRTPEPVVHLPQIKCKIERVKIRGCKFGQEQRFFTSS